MSSTALPTPIAFDFGNESKKLVNVNFKNWAAGNTSGMTAIEAKRVFNILRCSEERWDRARLFFSAPTIVHSRSYHIFHGNQALPALICYIWEPKRRPQQVTDSLLSPIFRPTVCANALPIMVSTLEPFLLVRSMKLKLLQAITKSVEYEWAILFEVQSNEVSQGESILSEVKWCLVGLHQHLGCSRQWIMSQSYPDNQLLYLSNQYTLPMF